MAGLARREKTEIAAVWAVAGAVYALAVLCAVARGPKALLYFSPALLGSLIAVWCVRRGVLVAVNARAVRDNRGCDQGAGGRRP
ncbi:hypothetical protein [Streptomyces parvus]|uniref:hypothetical protein n=1 Tax=Streptomyces parvus TaxID=66428 RepID=UPI0035DBE649